MGFSVIFETCYEGGINLFLCRHLSPGRIFSGKGTGDNIKD
jgi:hypothetical protein